MSRDLEAMEHGGYKTHPAFSQYMRALEKVPVDDNITRARSAYFEKFPSVFFEMFHSMFDKHIVSHWRDEKHLVYMIGGTPSLAKSFLQLLNVVTDAPADNDQADTTHFVFEDGRIELRHLQMNGGPVIVDQRQCMAFLTAGVDPFAMREAHIIKKEWPLLKKMAEATDSTKILFNGSKTRRLGSGRPSATRY